MGSVTKLVIDQVPEEVRASALAEILGISADRVRALKAEGVVISTRRGYYDLAASVQGYLAYWRSRAEGTSEDGDHERKLRDLEFREREARTLTAELGYHEKIGELYPAALIVDRWNQVQTRAKSQLQSLPGKWRGRHGLSPEVIQELAEDITDALNELARSDPFPPLE